MKNVIETLAMAATLVFGMATAHADPVTLGVSSGMAAVGAAAYSSVEEQGRKQAIRICSQIEESEAEYIYHNAELIKAFAKKIPDTQTKFMDRTVRAQSIALIDTVHSIIAKASGSSEWQFRDPKFSFQIALVCLGEE